MLSFRGPTFETPSYRCPAAQISKKGRNSVNNDNSNNKQKTKQKKAYRRAATDR